MKNRNTFDGYPLNTYILYHSFITIYQRTLLEIKTHPHTIECSFGFSILSRKPLPLQLTHPYYDYSFGLLVKAECMVDPVVYHTVKHQLSLKHWCPSQFEHIV